MFVRRQSQPTSLVFNTAVSSATGISAPPITDASPNPPTNAPVPAITTPPTPASSTADTASSTPIPPVSQQPGAASSADPRSPINLGTVVGACLGSFALLILVIVLVVWHSRRTRNASPQLRDSLSKCDNWNKLPDNARDSRRSSFESKPSLPHPSLNYLSEYPPTLPKAPPSESHPSQPDVSRYVLPAHPYSSSHSIVPESRNSPNGNPFADPSHTNKEGESDAVSLYSTTSNPFESVYSPPTGAASQINTSEGFSRSPFFTPHPDSSVQGEKWGLVGKERNVQESYAPSSTPAVDKLGSLIAALDLEASNSGEEKADRSMHGHLGKFTDD